MTNFDPHPVASSLHFYILPDHRGHWIVRERSDLAGGVFSTRKGAIRFALSETGGDASQLEVFRAAQPRTRSSQR
jgi:hypothetical protein